MNNLENIKLPENIDDITIKAVKEAKKARKDNKRNKKVFIAASIAIGIIAVSTLGGDLVSASIGNVVNKIESFFVGDLKEDVMKDYKSTVGVTKKSNNVKVTLNEYFMDEDDIYINAKFYNKGIKIPQDATFKVLVNGKEVPSESSVGSYKYNDDNSVDILFLRRIENVDLSSVKDVKIIFNDVTYVGFNNKENKKKGNWEFGFKYDGKKVANQVKNIEVNKVMNNINIHSIKVTPMKIAVKYSTDYSVSKARSYTGIELMDENGDIIRADNSHGDAEFTVSNTMMDTKNISEVTIVPYKIIDLEKVEYYKDKAIKVKIK